MIVQTTGDSTRAQVLRAKWLKPPEGTWAEGAKMAPAPVSSVTEVPGEQRLAYSRSQPWSEPSLVGGGDCRELGPSMS